MAELLSLFNFEVVLAPASSEADIPMVRAASFSEVSGLDISLELEQIREGGWNAGVRHLVKRATPGTLVLKRGLTEDMAFWQWVDRCIHGPFPLPYLNGEVRQYPPGGPSAGKPARWSFVNGLVSKVSAPGLNAATGGTVPIEELQISHEGLTRVSA